MLQAFIKNKLIINNLSELKTNEDALTSSVIGTLLMLPSKLLLKILSEASSDSFLNLNFGNLCSYEFWPHWDSNGTGNKHFVEPDVFLRFENIDVIIESKRNDEHQQDPNQWEKEIKSYYNEYSNDKTLILLAIGGINYDKTELINNNISIYKIKWKRILYIAQSILDKKQKNSKKDNGIIRILQMLITNLEIHGFMAIKWFKQMQYTYNISKNSTTEIKKWKAWNFDYLFNFKNNTKIKTKGIEIWKI